MPGYSAHRRLFHLSDHALVYITALIIHRLLHLPAHAQLPSTCYLSISSEDPPTASLPKTLRAKFRGSSSNSPIQSVHRAVTRASRGYTYPFTYRRHSPRKFPLDVCLVAKKTAVILSVPRDRFRSDERDRAAPGDRGSGNRGVSRDPAAARGRGTLR